MPIQDGNTVTVQYRGSLTDGTVFDASTPDAPLVFTVGTESMIPGFENAIVGREKGDTVKIIIPPDQAYGEYDENLVFAVPIAQVPAHIKPEEGLMLHVSTDQGELEVAIIEVTEEAITLDANHPLAGEHLTFEITVEDVE